MNRISHAKIRRLLLCTLFFVSICLVMRHFLPGRSSDQHFRISDTKVVTTTPSLDSLLDAVELEDSNLPMNYWRRQNNDKQKRTCAPLPNIFRLDLSNGYWQTVRSAGVSVQLLGAYYDARLIDSATPVVRLVSMIDQVYPTLNLHCQLWLRDQEAPVIVNVTSYKLVWYYKWKTGDPGDYHPYLLTCALPTDLGQIPAAVSLVNTPCDLASNLLKVVYQPPTAKRNFAVCVKGMDFLKTDYSHRLVEWIELISLLGADKIFFYQLQVHPNMSRVLEFYERHGLVQVVPITLPGNQPTHPVLQHLYLQMNKVSKRLNEVVTFNDCFYRNFNLFRYVVVLDMDEVIMPVNGTLGWKEMIVRLKDLSGKDNKTYSSFYARNVYFFDQNLDPNTVRGIPNYLFMTRHVYRAVNFTEPKKFIKSFLDTERVIIVHNHLPLDCKGGKDCWYPIPISMGQLQHYRRDCEKSVGRKICDGYKRNSILDTNIWRYKDELISRTSFVIKLLGLVASSDQVNKRYKHPLVYV